MAPARKRRRIVLSSAKSKVKTKAAPNESEQNVEKGATFLSGDIKLPIDRKEWKGWCEIESEPAFFDVMLREMGVQGLTINEVFSLDLLAFLPKPVHAMIFLFRYKEIDQDKLEASCPDHVWFANQVPNHSCATFALLNIVNNIKGLNLGSQLQSFKDYSMLLSPFERGKAVDSFDFVRRIHNSFAHELDMLNSDLVLKRKDEKWTAKKQAEIKKAEKELKEDPEVEAPIAEPIAHTDGLRRSTRQPKPRIIEPIPVNKPKPRISIARKPTIDNNAFHFISYMPINGEVWKLDGMDAFPQRLGLIDSDAEGDWMNVAKPALERLIAEHSKGQIQFSLMAVCPDPLVQERKLLTQNIRAYQETEHALDEVWQHHWTTYRDPDLVKGMSVRYGISVADIADAEHSEYMWQEVQSGDKQRLIKLHHQIHKSQKSCRETLDQELEAQERDRAKAALRRRDFLPFLKSWVDALGEQGALKGLAEKVRET